MFSLNIPSQILSFMIQKSMECRDLVSNDLSVQAHISSFRTVAFKYGDGRGAVRAMIENLSPGDVVVVNNSQAKKHALTLIQHYEMGEHLNDEIFIHSHFIATWEPDPAGVHPDDVREPTEADLRLQKAKRVFFMNFSQSGLRLERVLNWIVHFNKDIDIVGLIE